MSIFTAEVAFTAHTTSSQVSSLLSILLLHALMYILMIFVIHFTGILLHCIHTVQYHNSEGENAVCIQAAYQYTAYMKSLYHRKGKYGTFLYRAYGRDAQIYIKV